MTSLLERVTATPARTAGPTDWFTEMPPSDQQDIRDLLTARLRDDQAIRHSIVQLSEILIDHYRLPVRVGTVRARLAELTREIQLCPSRKASKKK